ncbi:MAG: ATP-binding protein [Candidatus Dormibacteria bacterium]
MNELTVMTLPDQNATSRELSARAAQLATRLAALLEQRCSPESGAAEAVDFLRRWAMSATSIQLPGLHPLDLLATRFGLTDDEVDVLLLAGLPDEHEGLASTFRSLHPQAEPRPTAGLAALLLDAVSDDRSAVRRLLGGGAVIRRRLVHLVGTGTFFERSLVPAERLWDALHGEDCWPATPERVTIGEAPPGLARWLDQPGARAAVIGLQLDEPRTLLVNSSDETVALGRCAALAARAGVRLVAGRVAADDPAAIMLLVAHAAVRDAIALLLIPKPAEPARAPVLAVGDIPGPVLVCAEQGTVHAAPDRAVLTIPLGPISTADHRDGWRTALPHLAEHAPALAARHPLDPALTAQVALDARSQQQLGLPIGLAEVSGLIRDRAGITLPPGIELTTPNVPWNRLVLPEEPAWLLRDAVVRLEHQALVLDDWGFRDQARATRGARLLFTGPPGTGKTLAAEAVATATGTDLLIVDVAQVVSKWIGETEKNLSAAFDVAERTQAVLFLDEADALFGARTEITDAHDRYANLETAYLLQRLDRFEGLAVLATNLRHNIDAAFVRRMDFLVEFPLPDLPGRRDLWALHLPAGVLADDVDIGALARLYPVPGGWIRNAAIAAGFLAASGDSRIGQQHLVAAMRREYAKAALPFPGEPPRRRDDRM